MFWCIRGKFNIWLICRNLLFFLEILGITNMCLIMCTKWEKGKCLTKTKKLVLYRDEKSFHWYWLKIILITVNTHCEEYSELSWMCTLFYRIFWVSWKGHQAVRWWHFDMRNPTLIELLFVVFLESWLPMTMFISFWRAYTFTCELHLNP